MRFSGGRTWWAHLEFTRIHIEPTILCKKTEDLRQLGAVILPIFTSLMFVAYLSQVTQ